ncbi:MAG: hypothetical protein ABSE95_13610 [Thermodesulfobacteriota bacterium]|jgi:hypothetical protein
MAGIAERRLLAGLKSRSSTQQGPVSVADHGEVGVDSKKIEKSILLTMKSNQIHLDKLDNISRNSNCNSLKEYLTRILALPSITIRDYK